MSISSVRTRKCVLINKWLLKTNFWKAKLKFTNNFDFNSSSCSSWHLTQDFNLIVFQLLHVLSKIRIFQNVIMAINTFYFKEIRLTFSSKYSRKWCNVKYLNGSYISGNVSHPFKLSDEKEINILEDSNIWLCIFQNVNIQRRQNWLCLCVFNNFADVGSSQ